MNAPPFDVAGLGNSCTDRTLSIPRWPAAGGSLAVRPGAESPGGQIAGALVGCARLGLRARMLLRIGDDEAGRMQYDALAAAGVELGATLTRPGVPSARALILVAPDGGRAVLWNTDPELAVAPDEIAPELIAESRLVLLDGKDGAACLRAARLAREWGRVVVGDLDCVYPHTAALLPWVDHLVAPGEFVLAFGDTLEAGMLALAAAGARQVVATLGAQGARAYAAGAWHHAPGVAIAAVDTTGAGDAFHAGYCYGLLQGWETQRRLRFANAAAALACTAPGAQAALPNLRQVEALLARS